MYTIEQRAVMAMDRLNLALTLNKIDGNKYQLESRKMLRDLGVKFFRVNERILPVFVC